MENEGSDRREIRLPNDCPRIFWLGRGTVKQYELTSYEPIAVCFWWIPETIQRLAPGLKAL